MSSQERGNGSQKLSIVIPVYNERQTIAELLRRVGTAPINGLDREIVVVDDGSTDGTQDHLVELEKAADPEFRLILQDKNQGKGAAIRAGFQHVTGDYVLIQDADLEYSPKDYPVLLQPLLDGEADAVYGSRFLGGPHRVLYYWHSIGNRLLTMLSNMLTDLNLTDMETCYKVFRADVLKKMTLTSKRFGIEPEMTAQLARQQIRIYEVPISYHGRTYAEGKKIGWKDGVSAIRAIVKFNLFPGNSN